MPVSFTTPAFQRQGVVAGFVLSAPVFGGVGQAAAGSVYFSLYNQNITLEYPTRVLNISPGDPNATPGYQHVITIAGRSYSYAQQVISDGSGGNAPDTILTIATNLANQINSYDPNAYATANAGGITLAPRNNTGATIQVGAPNDGAQVGMLIELTGNELIPTLTRGVCFAQGVLYAPADAPVLTAAPASQQSYLYFNSGTGFYWSASATPTEAADDACIGWVVANATEIIALSSSRLGTGTEAVVLPGGPVAVQVGTSASTDTGPPVGALGWDLYTPLSIETMPAGTPPVQPGMLEICRAGWTGPVANLAGVDAISFLLYYTQPSGSPAATLTAAAGAADTSLAVSGLLPVTAAQPVVFTFEASGTLAGGVEIGPGYEHNITIGDVVYVYVQQTSDTAASIALALAEEIQGAEDQNAMAVAVGATVALTPLQTNGNTVICTATDGNAPATLTETQPSYYLVDGEIVLATASTGAAATVKRAQKGSTAATHAIGAQVWAVSVMPLSFVWDCVQAEIPNRPGSSSSGGYTFPIIGLPTRNRATHPSILTSSVWQVPFSGLNLVAMDGWAANEYGDSAITEVNYATGLLCPGVVTPQALVAVSTATTLSPVAQLVTANAAGGAFTITLPPTAQWVNLAIEIVKVDASANAVTWQMSGTDTVPGVGASGALTVQQQSVRLTATA